LGLSNQHYHDLGRRITGDPRIKNMVLYPGFYRSYAPSFHRAFCHYVKGATGQMLEMR
jgi:hypothetical protein